jgi:hypothetical protein
MWKKQNNEYFKTTNIDVGWDNINMGLQETGWRVGGMDWIDMFQDREKLQVFVNGAMIFPV